MYVLWAYQFLESKRYEKDSKTSSMFKKATFKDKSI